MSRGAGPRYPTRPSSPNPASGTPSPLGGALEESRAVGMPLLEAETLTALAGLERSRGDEEAASALATSAGRIFRDMGAEEWGERWRRRVDEILG